MPSKNERKETEKTEQEVAVGSVKAVGTTGSHVSRPQTVGPGASSMLRAGGMSRPSTAADGELNTTNTAFSDISIRTGMQQGFYDFEAYQSLKNVSKFSERREAYDRAFPGERGHHASPPTTSAANYATFLC